MPGIVWRVLQAWHCEEGVTGLALGGQTLKGVTGLALGGVLQDKH